ncbi:MAG: signal recognition particle-docking protein FtsY [Deltaproteobacteria bacterium]
MGFFDKLKEGLNKTRKSISDRVDHLLAAFVKIDEDLFEELEEILVTSDIGMDTVTKIITDIKEKIKLRRITDPSQIKNLLQEEITEIIRDDSAGLKLGTTPSVLIVIGVNGTGKTTSIGKITANLRQKGKKVIIAAADTFRAAAIEQLEVWAQRAGAEVIKQQQGSDSASVVFDAIQAARARKVDVLICDTAGRLHNKKNLMEELSKIQRVIKRELPESDCEVLLVIDAATGQNGISQAKEFTRAANVTGIILTKLDGTAKGGVVVSIKAELGIPVKFIGVGEKIDDLQEFNAAEFSKALFEN